MPNLETLRAQARQMAQVEAELQRWLTATRGELDAVEATGDMEEKRRLRDEVRSLRERIEQSQWERAFLKQKLESLSSGREVREFETRIFTTV